jgi:ATP-dependent Clp protease ATP-binding subunit ClpB
MSNNIFEKLTNQLSQILDSSVSLALHNKNSEVENIHILCTTAIIIKKIFSFKYIIL